MEVCMYHAQLSANDMSSLISVRALYGSCHVKCMGSIWTALFQTAKFNPVLFCFILKLVVATSTVLYGRPVMTSAGCVNATRM